MTAAEAAAAIGDGIRTTRLDAWITEVPVADGGEGTRPDMDAHTSAKAWQQVTWWYENRPQSRDRSGPSVFRYYCWY